MPLAPGMFVSLAILARSVDVLFLSSAKMMTHLVGSFNVGLFGICLKPFMVKNLTGNPD